jgi:hypothetical protein
MNSTIAGRAAQKPCDENNHAAADVHPGCRSSAAIGSPSMKALSKAAFVLREQRVHPGQKQVPSACGTPSPDTTLTHPAENEPHGTSAGRMHAAVANDICLFGSPTFLYRLFAELREFQQQSCQHNVDTFAGLIGLWPDRSIDGDGG